MVETNVTFKRIIGQKKGKLPGATVVYFAGIHGNEPSGIYALQEVFEEIKNIDIRGEIIGISGNIWALENGKRFHEQDLNRIWKAQNIEALETGNFIAKNEDEKQQEEIFDIIQQIERNNDSPLYFFDLHTTSSQTVPFLTVNDSLLNRKFSAQIPSPQILGIEEYLDGPLLSYLNEKGYVSFGFEGGQHDDNQSIKNHKAFIYLSLVFSGVISKNQIDFSSYYAQLLEQSQGLKGFYEITERYKIQKEENFTMKEGFTNFQPILKGELLALSNQTPIYNKKKNIIFMPLYQSQGEDGYFLIQPTPKIFLQLSAWLRNQKIDRIFPLLPGVNWKDEKKTEMQVDLRIARFIAKPLFHLFGYRSIQKNNTILVIKNREYASKNKIYEKEKWV